MCRRIIHRSFSAESTFDFSWHMFDRTFWESLMTIPFQCHLVLINLVGALRVENILATGKCCCFKVGHWLKQTSALLSPKISARKGDQIILHPSFLGKTNVFLDMRIKRYIHANTASFSSQLPAGRKGVWLTRGEHVRGPFFAIRAVPTRFEQFM